MHARPRQHARHIANGVVTNRNQDARGVLRDLGVRSGLRAATHECGCQRGVLRTAAGDRRD